MDREAIQREHRRAFAVTAVDALTAAKIRLSLQADGELARAVSTPWAAEAAVLDIVRRHRA